jgi:hypothetical protein
MEKFLALLKEKGTSFEQISDNEITIPAIALVATNEQYENNALSSEYVKNPIFCDEVKIQLTFTQDRINWMIVLPPADVDEE